MTAAAADKSKILYVDDDATLCRAVARLFGDDPRIEVETLTSPIAAARLILAEPFDVVISDLRMPEMSGLDLLAGVARDRPEARRLLISAHADFTAALDAINRVGIDRLLVKPCEPEDMRAAVRTAVESAALKRENARVNAELRQRTHELQAVNLSLDALVEERTSNLLDALVSALDLRDSETQWHSRRVGRYARRLAAELGIDGRELDDIERGATLHDIGKIGVRDAVLLKPGPLDEAEWVEMRRHPALGHEILSDIEFLARARMIPLHHQERFDGSGYPQGLKGTDICIGARIFSVVDAYDAITNDRPYRKCRTYEVARGEIVKYAGTQFDPDIVQAWLRIPQAEWNAIREEIEEKPPSSKS